MTAALVLAAHGSRHRAAAETVLDLAGLVGEAAAGVPVSVGFLGHATPRLDATLDAAADRAGRVVVVPLLLTAAWHDRTDIPAVLSAARERHPGTDLVQAPPLGTDTRILDVVAERLAGVGIGRDDAATGVVLGAIGSSRPAANAEVARAAETLHGRTAWLGVEVAFATTAPGVATAAQRLRSRGAHRIALARYALAPGRLPGRLATSARAAGVDVVAPVIGAHPAVAAVVLDRYTAAQRRASLDATA